jgi:hypothetical protein
LREASWALSESKPLWAVRTPSASVAEVPGEAGIHGRGDALSGKGSAAG